MTLTCGLKTQPLLELYWSTQAHAPERHGAQTLACGPPGKPNSPPFIPENHRLPPWEQRWPQWSHSRFSQVCGGHPRGTGATLDAHTSLSSFGTEGPRLQVASEQSKRHNWAGKCRGENTRNTIWYYLTLLLFYFSCLSLSRTISQRNSIFITKGVSYAREKTVALLLHCYFY